LAALVVTKWLAVQAVADTPSALADVKALMEHEYSGTRPSSRRQ
jgi:hypothetical protein